MFFQPKIETHTLYLSQDEEGSWTVFYKGPDHSEPVPMFDNLRHASSAHQFTCEALRRLEHDLNQLEVVDPTGTWAFWCSKRFNIPTHTLF